MLFPARTLLFTWLAGTAIASAQCPVDTVIVKGRVENSTRDFKMTDFSAYMPQSDIVLKASR